MKTFLIILLFSTPAICFAQLQFVENKGQWDDNVKFRTDFSNGSFFLEQSGFSVLLHNEDDLHKLHTVMHGEAIAETAQKNSKQINPPGVILKSHAYKVQLLGASSTAVIVPEKIQKDYSNYFLGNDPAKWKGNCRIYNAITYKNIYPNIDVRYYSDKGTLKYDFIIHPGGDINNIQLKYDGVNKISTQKGDLIINTSIGEVKELNPYSYQLTEKGRSKIDCRFIVNKNIIKFSLTNYDPGSTIVIDPTLVFSSFAGGTRNNWGYTATPDPDGSFFAGGICFGQGYPVSTGAFQQTFNGGIDEDGNGVYDISIIKLSADGSTRLYATYLGGSGNEQPHSLICDNAGNLIMSGRTNSPINNDPGKAYPLTYSFKGNAGGYDIILTKLNSSGSALLGSVRIGGAADDGVNIKPKYIPLGVPNQNEGAYDTRRNYGDDARSEVIIDKANNIYLASCTQSTDFPVTDNAFQKTFGGGGAYIKQDGLILKFNADLSVLAMSSFFGGNGNDACFVLAVNPVSGNIYAGGATTSSNLPGDKTNVTYPSFQGGVTDGFVTELSPDAATIIKTTYIGTNDNAINTDGNDMLYGLKFDKLGYPYIMGTTTGNWQPFNASFYNNGGKQFICKLKPDLSGYEYSTVFGTNSPAPNISPVAFLVDRCQNVYVSGWGGEFNAQRGYPCATTRGMDFLATANAIQSTTDGKDFFFFVLGKNATSQLFGSFYGVRGGFDDHVDGGTSRFDEKGIIYQAICADCVPSPSSPFPTTPGVWSPNNSTGACNLAAVKIEMNFDGVGASIRSTINNQIDTAGCLPLDVVFTDTLAKGKKYIWFFNDGTKSDTTVSPNNSISHTFNATGIFRVMLVSVDSLTCNIADTAFINVRVSNNKALPDFTGLKIGDCKSLSFQFNNTTTAPVPVFNPGSFSWDFGDGTPLQNHDNTPISHTYAAPGTYNVKLILADTSFCNAPDSITKPIRLALNLVANFDTPAAGCVPYSATFNNTSIGGTDFIWDFGDGTTSAEINPVHSFDKAGSYIIKLNAIDTFTCNRQDEKSFTLIVSANPVADFDFLPKPGDINKPVRFTNLSTGANQYQWNFGDGETATSINPDHLFNATGFFNVCLAAINTSGCTDTICKQVEAEVTPLLDVPTAFTPGKFGVNGIIMVESFGISKMEWKIYNRWGQLIFFTNNKKQGWDGTYKNVLQPMDVYTYTLDAEFFNGKKIRKTGDITLLR